jgi:hypothetical protein
MDNPPPLDPTHRNIQVQTVVIAAVVLADTAGKISSKFDTFATWLLAGFGAAVALLLSSHDALAFVPAGVVKVIAEYFLAAAIITVLEKYLSIIVCAGAEAAAFSRTTVLEHFKTQKELGFAETLDMQRFMNEFLQGLLPPARWLAARQVRKALAGDLASGGRMLSWVAQSQGFLVLIELGLFLRAVARIVGALPGN